MEQFLETLKGIPTEWLLISLAVSIVLILTLVVILSIKCSRAHKIRKKQAENIMTLERESTDKSEEIKELSLKIIDFEDKVKALEGEIFEHKKNLSEANKVVADKDAAILQLKANVAEKETKIEELNDQLSLANNERARFKENYEILLKAIELKNAAGEEPATNEPEELVALKMKSRKELFKLAHEAGLGNFAQWSNAKLAEEIYKKNH